MKTVGAPLFIRLFLTIVGCVTAVQVINFAVIVMTGPPAPPIYSVDQVAAALAKGSDPGGGLRLVQAADAVQGSGEHAASLKETFARRLAVTTDNVRVMVRNHGPGWASQGDPVDSNPALETMRANFLIGEFEVALHRRDGHWTVAKPTDNGRQRWQNGAFLWLASTLCAAALFAWLLARRISKPIAMFAVAAERLGRNPQSPPLPLSSPREIAHAANAFNEMQRRLNRYVADRTLMIGAIAHDLRSPLMRLSLRLDQLPDKFREPLERDVAEMSAMIAAATNYVRDRTIKAPRHPLDLRELLEQLVREQYAAGSVSLNSGDPVTIEGDVVALRAMFGNLIQNALRYAGDAEISISLSGPYVSVQICDHGPGIATDDIDRMFEPFFRGEESRNRDTGGIGLGLASARGSAREHGGDISIENHPGGGVVATVTLPL